MASRSKRIKGGTGFDLGVLLGQQREPFAIHIDCIQADVDEHFGTVAQFQANRMERTFHNHGNGRVCRGDDSIARRFDSDAVAHHLLREGIVRYFADVDEVAGDKGFQLHGTVVFIDGSDGFSSRSCRRFCRSFFRFRNRAFYGCRHFPFHEGVEVAADIGHGQADDDLDGVTVLDQAEGTGIGELAGRSDLIRVVDRDAQAGCAVGDFADVIRTAEAIEEDLGLQGIGTAGNAFLFHFFLGFVFRFGEQFVFAAIIGTARRGQIEVKDEEAEDDEVNGRKAEANGNLQNVGPGMIAEQGNPVLDEAIDEAAAEVARQADEIERRRQGSR